MTAIINDLMIPRPLIPISLEEALTTKRNGTEESAYNSILMMVRSNIMGYFPKMAREFDALADALGITPQQLAMMSFGEAAHRVSRACGEGSLEEGSPGVPEAFAEESYSVLDAFLRPVAHAAMRSCKEERSLVLSQMKDLDYEALCSSEMSPRALLDRELTQDYFSDHLIARQRDCLEWRLLSYFMFELDDYCEAVASITGDAEQLTELLAPYHPENISAPNSLLTIAGWLGTDCKKRELWWDCFDPLSEEVAVSPPAGAEEWGNNAYKALYLLFVRPFALLHERSAT